VAGASRRAIPALATCIAVLLVGGVAAALTVDQPKAGGRGRAAQVVATKPPEAAPAPPIDLAAVVVPGPVGFDQIPDTSLVVGGAVSVDKLAAERPDPSRAQAVFAETGLVGGFVRAWQRPSTAELVTVRLYQFASPDGAKAYATRAIGAMAAPPATTFIVPATTDTVGIDSQVPQGSNRVVYVFERKGRVVAAIAATLVPPPDGGFLPPMARSQLSLLP